MAYQLRVNTENFAGSSEELNCIVLKKSTSTVRYGIKKSIDRQDSLKTWKPGNISNHRSNEENIESVINLVTSYKYFFYDK